MTKQQRSLIDELADRAGEFIENLERLLQPKPEPVRVPVRVPTQQRRRRRR